MTAQSVLDRVPVDEITDEARQVDLGRVALTVLAGVLFAVGWLFGRLALAIAWAGVAVKLGWRQGRTATVASAVASGRRDEAGS